MASPTRPSQNLKFALIMSRIVKSGTTLTKGQCVKVTTNPYEVDASGAGDKIYGIVLDESIVGDGSIRASICLDNAIIMAKVGTGGATYGKEAIMASDATGLTDQTLGGGTTVRYVAGTWEETGVVGDLVALRLGPYASVSS